MLGLRNLFFFGRSRFSLGMHADGCLIYGRRFKSSLASNRVLYITREANLRPKLRRPYHVFTFNGNRCVPVRGGRSGPFPFLDVAALSFFLFFSIAKLMKSVNDRVVPSFLLDYSRTRGSGFTHRQQPWRNSALFELIYL